MKIEIFAVIFLSFISYFSLSLHLMIHRKYQLKTHQKRYFRRVKHHRGMRAVLKGLISILSEPFHKDIYYRR
jgi:hypothetical protein